VRRVTNISAHRSLQPLPALEPKSHPRAAYDLALAAKQLVVCYVVAAIGLSALVRWPTGKWFMSTVLKIAWLYLVTGTRG
jgi:hypothetical protein